MKKVLIIGDSMLDVYHQGKVERISPEAPVPVFVKLDSYERLGGACNVAANIRSLSGETKEKLQIDYFGFYSYKINNMLENCEISCSGVPVQDVVTKNRYICGNYQVFRVDENEKYSLEYEEILQMKLRQFLDSSKNELYDLIIVSDYNKGTVNFNVLKMLENYDKNTLKIIDLKKLRKGMEHFDFSSSVFKCNQTEYDLNNQIEDINCKAVVVTMGENGYRWLQKNPFETGRMPSVALDKPTDVTGAGDVFLAAMAVSFLSGKVKIHEMTHCGNIAAAEKIKHMGTVAIKKDWI